MPGLIARSKKGKKYEDDDIDRDSEMQRKRDGKVRTPRKFLKARFTLNQRGKNKDTVYSKVWNKRTPLNNHTPGKRMLDFPIPRGSEIKELARFNCAQQKREKI